MIKTLLLILITVFIPPVGVFLVAGCGADFFINLLLTILGYFPGHIHAFYVEYVYIKRRDEIRAGIFEARPAPGIYSQKVQNGGHKTVPVAPAPAGVEAGYGGVPAQQGYVQEQQQGYGTVH
ncbi:hypothetical protein AA0119_g3430 [Alternaria tenuissima]|uniref:Stress response RCI peptide n=1 Tax=Alternaria tenuissima TaxID=119927 RepID=A0A4Q4PMY1_9PLEO|nr:hypothetical protein AA0115_g2989 [Alternaria tenuissima]RYN55682.1 hypothetical protein AA0114_g3363 [Alternaria tenuissima]RYO04937.1 hypothetical protein AA0119_g3430 [Alternaria tenuissima]RYO16690.1 hypothetical protein AA0121_g5962 [Alternaria tenuissima]